MAHKLCWTATQRRLLRERSQGVGPAPLVAAIELDGPVDAVRLDTAWRELQWRHPFLRLRLRGETAEAADDVRPLLRADLPGSSPLFRTESAKILQAVALARDLERDGPVEAVLIRTGPEASLLICSIDHLATDGWSFGLIAREWSALYQGRSLRPVPDTNAVIAGYADRVGAESGAVCDLADEFKSAAAFPLAHSDTAWALQQVDLPLAAARGIRARAAKQRSTPFALALASLGRAICIEYGKRDLIVSAHVANRTVPQSQSIVCATYNTVPLRVVAPSSDEMDQWVVLATRATIRALKRQSLPFAAARDTLAGITSPEALTRVMLNSDEHPFLGFVLPNVEITEASMWSRRQIGGGIHAPWYASSATPWPAGITISLRETWDSLQLYVHYGARLGDRAAMMILGRVTEGIAILADSQ